MTDSVQRFFADFSNLAYVQSALFISRNREAVLWQRLADVDGDNERLRRKTEALKTANRDLRSQLRQWDSSR